MPSWTDSFNDLASWSSAGDPNVTISSTRAYDGVKSARLDMDGAFEYLRLDTVDGGSTATMYWIAYAFYLESWADPFTAGTSWYLPNVTNFSSIPGASSGLGPVLDPTSSSTGNLVYNLFSPTTVTAAVTSGAWHTLRLGIRASGTRTYGELWLDNTQLLQTDIADTSTQPPRGAWFGNDLSNTAGILHVDAMTWNPGSDPGEPDTTPIVQQIPRGGLATFILESDASGNASASTLRGIEGEVLTISMGSGGTILCGTGGTTDFTITRTLDGGTIASLSNVAPPFRYQTHEPVHSLTGGTTAYTLGTGPVLTDAIPVWGSVTVAAAQCQPLQLGTVYLRYRP